VLFWLSPALYSLVAENLYVDVLMWTFYLFLFGGGGLITDGFIMLDSVESNESFEGNDLESIWKEAVLDPQAQ
jgi:hypothetical protein